MNKRYYISFAFVLLILKLINQSNIPASWCQDYFNEHGQWTLTLDQDYAILEADYWKYISIEASSGHLKISLARTDTICYFNPQGQYICALKPRSTSLDLRSNGQGFQCIRDGNPAGKLFTADNKPMYQPTQDIPDTKPGMATLKGELKATANNGLEDIYSIRVRYQNYLWQTQITVEAFLDPQRRFSLQIPLAGFQDVYLICGDSATTLFLAPGENLFLQIADIDPTKWFFMGPTADASLDYQLFNRDGVPDRYYWPAYEDKLTLDINAHQSARKAIMDHSINGLHDYAAKHPVSAAFQTWLPIHQEVWYFEDLIRYSWIPRTMQGKSLYWETDDPFYDHFIDDFHFSDSGYRISSYYGNCMREMGMFYAQKFGKYTDYALDIGFWRMVLDQEQADYSRTLINQVITDLKNPPASVVFWNELWKKYAPEIQKHFGIKNSTTRFDSTFSLIRSNESGLTPQDIQQLEQGIQHLKEQSKKTGALRKKYSYLANLRFYEKRTENLDRMGTDGQLLATMVFGNAFSDAIEGANSVQAQVFLNVLRSRISDPAILQLYQYRYDQLLSQMEQPLPAYAHLTDLKEGSPEAFIQSLSKKHPGQYLYLDVWATWCAPCRGEMPFAADTKEFLQDYPLTFIYLCMSGDKPAMESLIKQYQLSGDHYFLEEPLSRTLSNLLHTKGYPTYLIINPDGQIVNWNASRPSQKESLLAELEQLMKR